MQVWAIENSQSARLLKVYIRGVSVQPSVCPQRFPETPTDYPFFRNVPKVFSWHSKLVAPPAINCSSITSEFSKFAN